MAQQPPTAVQLLEKTDFTKQHIVPLHLPSPHTPLTTPNTVLIRTRTISLTTNNLTYARLGGIPALGWWNVYPLPAASSLAASPFRDQNNNTKDLADEYMRISAWGYAEILASTVPGLEAGIADLFGYLPIGTAPETLQLQPHDDGVPGHWQEVSPRRAHLVGVYNLYHAVPRGHGPGDGGDSSRGWDALMALLWQTGYLLNRAMFAWQQVEGEGGLVGLPAAVHPLGNPVPAAWTAADADLAGTVVVLLAASGKTALSFAHELRFARPDLAQPARVIGVGSARSRAFTRGTELFDEVLTYEDLDDEVFKKAAKLGPGRSRKMVLLDFGARSGVADRWAEFLEGKSERLQAVVVGTAPLATEMNELVKRTQLPGSGVFQAHMGLIKDRVVEAIGAAKYYADQEEAWEKFKADGGIQGLQIKWGTGLDQFSEGWDVLVRGEYGPEQGLVYEL